MTDTWNPTDEPVDRAVPLADLAPHAQNYKQHPERQIKKLRRSLQTFGQPRPIVVWRGTILAGHGVAQAAQEEGWTSIRASIVPDAWTAERAAAYLVADNETQRGGETDAEALAELIEQSRAADLDILALGFDDGELEALLEGLAPAGADAWDAAFGGLPEGDRAPFQQMTFTVSDQQAETVKRAMKAAQAEPFENTGNENSNGNALARICEAYLG